MMLIRSLLILPLHLTVHHFTHLNRWTRVVADVFGVGVGLLMLWEKGRVSLA
jgi:hypothetical protein